MKTCSVYQTMAFFLFMLSFGLAANQPALAGSHPCPCIIRSKAPLEHVQAQMDKLTPVLIAPDYSYLPDSEQKVISYLVRASRHIDKLFLEQVSSANREMESALREYNCTSDQVYYDYFKIMYGPWDRLDANAPFINLDTSKPAGANYYPADLTQEEFDAWLGAHPDDEESFNSPFTVIKRRHHHLKAVPYSEEYAFRLDRIAWLLKKAATITNDPTLAAYLSDRARDFATNDYRLSDIDWINLVGDIELVIGPYETYEDELMGLKAAFESFVCIVDQEESAKLTVIEAFRDALVANYPLPADMAVEPKGLSSPIKVVNEIYSAGDARAGIPAIAFNLPNNEWVRENVGSKNVMLKNMLEAKYNGILVPIIERILDEADQGKPSFDGFFNFVLMHEISHGLGPGSILVNGEQTTVREQLKELYSTIEECQADTLSIYNTQYLIDAPDSAMPPGLEDALYASYLAGMFRSIRFGTESAHGGAITIELNWHLENGGFQITPEGRFFLDVEKLKASVRSLATTLLTIELKGDYDGAKALMDSYRSVSPQVQAALDMISDVPVDVKKEYPFDN